MIPGFPFLEGVHKHRLGGPLLKNQPLEVVVVGTSGGWRHKKRLSHSVQQILCGHTPNTSNNMSLFLSILVSSCHRCVTGLRDEARLVRVHDSRWCLCCVLDYFLFTFVNY
jgi:hypothetical protein